MQHFPAHQEASIGVNHSTGASSNPSQSTPQSEIGSSLTAATSTSDVDMTAVLEEMICSPDAIQHIMTTWSLEDDWYHEIIHDSPFTDAIRDTPANVLVVRRYAGVLYGIVAIVAQVHPSELDALLLRLNSSSGDTKSIIGDHRRGFESAEEVGRVAEHAARVWLERAIQSTSATDWNAAVFQTSFLLTKLCKFMGRWSEYRDNLVRDIGRLQRARLHHLSSAVRHGSSSREETESKTLYRVFWHYFTLERCVWRICDDKSHQKCAIFD
jgi:hypothetical protein